MIVITLFFFIGGAAATLMRIELLTPQGDLVTSTTYNKLFTLHGVLMIWFFLIPSVPAVLGNFILPMMIGARDVAFPRLNLASWYLFIAGGAVALWAVIAGGVDTGWTFYTPYSSAYANGHVIAMATGIFIAGFGSIATGLNFIVTIHKMRAPGMTWHRLPLFIWTIYATSIILVLATPVLAITLVLMALERAFGIGIFNPAIGGDPLLFQHLFWFYSHPAVYIMILPGMGVVSELIACFARKRIFGYRFVAYASIAIAVLGFLVWGHHMFVSSQSIYAGMVFSVLSFLVSIPSAIKVFNWTATLYRGSIWFQTPLLYALGFHRPLYDRRTYRAVSRGARRGCASYRHLFRHRAFSLHHGRRDGHGLPWRPALLVAEDHRAAVSRGAGQALDALHFPGIQSHVLPAVPSGVFGHAAALSCLCAGVSNPECALHRGRVSAGGRLYPAADLSAVVAALRARRPGAIHGRPRASSGRRHRPRPRDNFDSLPVVTEEAYNYDPAAAESEAVPTPTL